MMARQKSQTHCLLDFGHDFKPILSVKENANKSLFITTHLKGLRNIDQADQGIAHSRHSLHLSPNSPTGVYTVKGVTTHEDGSKIVRHLVTTAIANDRLQPIYVRSVIHPREIPGISLPARGETVPFPIYNPDSTTMHYALWFASARSVNEFPEEVPFLSIRLDFTEVTLLIPICFTTNPSPPNGKVIEYASTSEARRSDKHERLGNRPGPAEGAISMAAPGYMVRDFNRIISTPFPLTGLMPDAGPLVPQQANFLKNPIL